MHAPEQYGAIHFHEDDLEDCRWETDISLDGAGRPSQRLLRAAARPGRGGGLGAVLRAAASWHGDGEGALPRPDRQLPRLRERAQRSRRARSRQAIIGHTSVIAEQDFYLYGHSELGLSTYDLHTDGSGVHSSSALRPIINMRPKFRMSPGTVWQFPADLHLVDWLDAMGFEYDVATDRELHDEGAALLERYNVVFTGSHPEYYSREMLDAWETYLAGGGRGMYLGSNGFYWIIAWHPEKPGLIEVRKGEYGSRAWQARPGEYSMQLNGERSGLWRGRARAPQKVFGTGFTAEGFDHASYYVQLPDARDPACAFIMDGIGPDEKIGDFGLVGGGAAGYELDRYDLLARNSAGTRGCSPTRRATRTTTRTSSRRSSSTTPARAARPTSRCGPTSPTSRRRTAAPCSRRARSPGAGASRTTGTTTTSRG